MSDYDPALYCDHGRWQVTRDETCLYLPRVPFLPAPRCFTMLDGRAGYWLCRAWCLLHGYGWLPEAQS